MMTRTVLGLCSLVLVLGACSESSDAGLGGDGGGNNGECFAPDRNLDQAYTEDMSGCTCDGEGSACVDGVALVCEENQWVSVIDGPCMPTPEIACEGRLDSVMDCLELFSICVELDTGTFCGNGPITGNCPDGEIVQTAGGCMMDDAYCVELPNGFYCTGTGTPS